MVDSTLKSNEMKIDNDTRKHHQICKLSFLMICPEVNSFQKLLCSHILSLEDGSVKM